MTSYLVVDLDGTLVLTDTLVESCIRLCKINPLYLFILPIWLLKGRSIFKANVAKKVSLSVQSLPYRSELLDYIHQEKHKGRKIVLATAANESIANQVAAHLNIFDLVFASTRSINLKGDKKLEVVRNSIGDDFVYAGDSKSDVPIWLAAKAAILVDVSPKTSERVRKSVPVEKSFDSNSEDATLWLRALRVHQWLKNLLLFVPLMVAFSYSDFDKLFSAIGAFFAFSLTASATYIWNDLLDLDNDRVHPRKKNRPFASAKLSIIQGLLASFVLLALGLYLAFAVSLGVFMMLLLYLVTTISYTLCLKSFVLIDVIVLSLLYALRIFSGSVATEIPVSNWLLVFSVFLFFSLALVKRCSELVSLKEKGKSTTHGRDYRISDLIVLWPLGVGSALAAVLVFGLFASSTEVQIRYQSPHLLWLVGVGLIYWLARLWIKTSRGEMHDDPLVFAARDFGSAVTLACMVLAMLCAHLISFEI